MQFVQFVHTADRFARRNPRESGDPPRAPLQPLFAGIAAASVALGAGAAAGLSGRFLVAAPLVVALLGALLSVQRWEERRQRRQSADEWIVLGLEGSISFRLRGGWRVRELTSARERKLLARSLRRLVADLSAARLPGATPLNRAAVRPYRAELTTIADRLDELARPVSAAGILGVRRLLTDPESVLYARPCFDEQPRDIGAELGATLDRLEVRH